MESQNNKLQTRGSRFLMSRRDWVYLLSLLIPFVVYSLVLKGFLVFSAPEDPAIVSGLGLMQSDFLFNLGYVLLWVGLFVVARKGLLRWVSVGLFHVITILIAFITTIAYQYFKVTGSTLDSHYLLFWLSSPEGTGGPIASELTPGILVSILAMVIYTVLGPPLVTRFVTRWRGWPDNSSRNPEIFWLHWLQAFALGLIAYALFSFSLVPAGGWTSTSKSLARHAFVHLMVTAADIAKGEKLPHVIAGPITENQPSRVNFLPTTSTQRRNVVLIFLESTRATATTPYNKDLRTTPFLDELAESSLLVQHAYAVIPHTHNALIATNCGIEPPLDLWGTRLLSVPDSIPATCLPHLLKAQGYNTVYFMSHSKGYERSENILENLGYEEFYSVESMDTEGFEKTYYWGYEDDIMLEPSRVWLQKNRETPFLAAYLTSAPHHAYLAPQKRYGRVEFTENDLLNRYLNAVRNQDFFLKNLLDQYKQLGLYENTVFIILGDHGEGFGEHGRFVHSNIIYEEGVRIPLLIHDPKRFENGTRLAGPVNQLDILPTVADLLGYKLQGGAYVGSSLVRPVRNDRTLMFSCWGKEVCLASLKGMEKYIYHFGDRLEEFFDLSTDSAERNNLAGQMSPEELNKRRFHLLEWRAKVLVQWAAAHVGH